MQHPEAMVEDTSEAVLALYDLVVHIPNVLMEDVDDWQDMGQEDALDMLASPGRP